MYLRIKSFWSRSFSVAGIAQLLTSLAIVTCPCAHISAQDLPQQPSPANEKQSGQQADVPGQTGSDDRLKSIEQRLERIERLLKAQAVQQGFAATAQEEAQEIPKRFIESAGGGSPEPALDTDRDGLTDVEEAIIGSDPAKADTDGDALLDGWEVQGVNGIDLAVMGANPLRKDIFVEMDFMTRDSAANGLAPNDVVLDGIRTVFEAAFVFNPDGSRGISIHLDSGNEVPHDGDLNPAPAEFGNLKSAHFDPRRAPVFHYMIWADTYNGGSSSGNAFAIPNSDFMVTLGAWNSGNGGTDLQKVGTFIHELGHDLGLRHGGSDHTGNKPNHLSVMNYSFQTRGILVNGTRRFDFQPFALPTIDERALRESFGLGGSSDLASYSTIFSPPTGPILEVSAAGAIDWDNDGSIDTSPVRVNVNGDLSFTELLGTPDEWNQLIYNGGAIGSRTTLGLALKELDDARELLPEVELTEEMDLRNR